MRTHPQRIEPKPGQESVWDYPRPPRLERSKLRVRVELHGRTIADTVSAYRVLETSHPPVYYIPREDIDASVLTPARGSSFCEFKGVADYLTAAGVDSAAWFYPTPSQGYEPIRDHVAFYPAKMDTCWVGDELVQPQEGDFYGGWVTSGVVGPFKGAPGSWGW